MTRYLGNVGRVIGAVGVILTIATQIKEDEQEQHKRKLRDARDSVRRASRETSRQIEAAFWTSYEHFSRDFYDGELEAIDEALNDLVGDRQTRNEMAEALNQIVSEAHTTDSGRGRCRDVRKNLRFGAARSGGPATGDGLPQALQ